jgi:hypothetical protein
VAFTRLRTAPFSSRISEQEQANVRRAIRYLRARLGSWVAVARAVRIKRATVRRVRDGGRMRPYVAGKVARAAVVPIEDLPAGKYPHEGTCPHCGHSTAGMP